MAAEWSVVLFSRDPVLLSQTCVALLLALSPLRWHGACLPLIPRTRGGAAMLAKLRAAARHMPMLLGVLQSPNHPHAAPSTPSTPRTVHVLLPDGRPVWARSEKLPIMPPALARHIEATVRVTLEQMSPP